jgi:hypothetical protein
MTKGTARVETHIRPEDRERLKQLAERHGRCRDQTRPRLLLRGSRRPRLDASLQELARPHNRAAQLTETRGHALIMEDSSPAPGRTKSRGRLPSAAAGAPCKGNGRTP